MPSSWTEPVAVLDAGVGERLLVKSADTGREIELRFSMIGGSVSITLDVACCDVVITVSSL